MTIDRYLLNFNLNNNIEKYETVQKFYVNYV